MIPPMPKTLRSIIRRLRQGPPDDHYGAYGPDAQMTADGMEALMQRQDNLDERLRRLEGDIRSPTDECFNCGGTRVEGTCTCTSFVPWPSGEPGERPE